MNKKSVVYCAHASTTWHMSTLIMEHVLKEGHIPIEPFTCMGWGIHYKFAPEYDQIINNDLNLLVRCDELWVFGDISRGVRIEIEFAEENDIPIRYFDWDVVDCRE